MLRLLQLVIAAAGYSALRRKVKSSLQSAILIAIAGLLGLVGLSLLGAALWLALAAWYGAFYAHLWMGIGLSGLALLVLLIALLRRPPRAPAPSSDPVLPLMTGVMQQLNDRLKAGTSASALPIAAIAVALIAGVLIGRGGDRK